MKIQKLKEFMKTLSIKIFLPFKKNVLFLMKVYAKANILLVYFFLQNFFGYLCFNFLVLYYSFSFYDRFELSHLIALFTCLYIQGTAVELYFFSKVDFLLNWLEKIINDDAFFSKYVTNHKLSQSVLKAFVPAFFFTIVNNISMHYQMEDLKAANDKIFEDFCQKYGEKWSKDVAEEYLAKTWELLEPGKTPGKLKQIMQHVNIEKIIENYKKSN